MRKWLILILILALVLGGITLWLAGKADNGKPEAGEVRVEVEGLL